MMTFRVRLKKARKPNQPRLRFDLEKLSDPDVACTFQATRGGKFAPLIGLSDEDMDIDTIITTYNTAVTDAVCEILGKERRRKKPLVTKDVLNLCDERRDLKKKRYEAEGANEYREANRRIQKAVKTAKEDWIGAQCEEIETCLNKNNNKRAYQLVRDLTSEKQGQLRQTSPFSVMLLQSQLPHGGSVADLLLGVGCSPELRCLHNSHSCTVLSNILSICRESLFLQ